jgi:hypothetical protein
VFVVYIAISVDEVYGFVFNSHSRRESRLVYFAFQSCCIYARRSLNLTNNRERVCVKGQDPNEHGLKHVSKKKEEDDDGSDLVCIANTRR